LAEPALGKVMVTVDVVLASSVTMVSPLVRVVTEAEVALDCCGVVAGRL
jgi:hypothetical protein